MGHLYIICGPPGAGKTTLFNRLHVERPNLDPVKRVTTRKSRPEEEENTPEESREYRFKPRLDYFCSNLVVDEATSMIEWNGKYYSTHRGDIEQALSDDSGDRLLLEDIPSAIHLKERFGSQVTVVFLFVAAKKALLEMEFVMPWRKSDPAFQEWTHRLEQKWLDKTNEPCINPKTRAWSNFLNQRIKRALPDLAFVAGRINARKTEFYVLENPRDNRGAMVEGFKKIVGKWVRVFISHSREDEAKALELKSALDSESIPCFLDCLDLLPGTPFADKIEKEVKKCSHLIVMVSRSAANSDWMPYEVGQAVSLGKKVIPLLIEKDLRIPDYLAHLAPVNDIERMVRQLRKVSRW